MSKPESYLEQLYCDRCVSQTEHYRTAAHTWVCDACGKVHE